MLWIHQVLFCRCFSAAVTRGRLSKVLKKKQLFMHLSTKDIGKHIIICTRSASLLRGLYIPTHIIKCPIWDHFGDSQGNLEILPLP